MTMTTTMKTRRTRKNRWIGTAMRNDCDKEMRGHPRTQPHKTMDMSMENTRGQKLCNTMYNNFVPSFVVVNDVILQSAPHPQGSVGRVE
jgi:hypothetical protein